MVDLMGVLAAAARAITVGSVGQDLHTAALPARLLPALLLHRDGGSVQPLQNPKTPTGVQGPRTLLSPCVGIPQPHTRSQDPLLGSVVPNPPKASVTPPQPANPLGSASLGIPPVPLQAPCSALQLPSSPHSVPQHLTPSSTPRSASKPPCAPPGSAPALFMLPHSLLHPQATISSLSQPPAPLQSQSPDPCTPSAPHPSGSAHKPQTLQTPGSSPRPLQAPGSPPHLDHVQLGHLVLLQAHGQQDVVLLDQHGGGGGQRGQLLRGLLLHRTGPASGQLGPVRHPFRTARGALSSARYRSVRV